MPFFDTLTALSGIGGLVGSFLDSRGAADVPEIAEFQPIDDFDFDQGDAVAEAFGSNSRLFNQLFPTADNLNQFRTEQALRAIRAFNPAFDELRDQSASNILSFQRGELPQETAESIQRTAAELGVRNFGPQAGGDDGLTQNLQLRNLGNRALELSLAGTSLAGIFNQQNASFVPAQSDPSTLAPLFIPSPGQQLQNSLVSAQQQVGIDEFNATGGQRTQQDIFNANAAGDPNAAFQADAFRSLIQILNSRANRASSAPVLFGGQQIRRATRA